MQKSWVSSNAPSVEALTEFTVDTNGFKAEYSHAGGGVMTFVTKSGTNQFHGTAYEFLRNNDFDANDWFSNRAGKARQIYKQNDFGATIGGPVWIPHVYHGQNKTFFFFSYEGFRNRNGATNASATIPTPEMYTGDFSKWVNAAGQQIPIYDPTSQTTNPDGLYQSPARRSPATRSSPRISSVPLPFKGVLGVLSSPAARSDRAQQRLRTAGTAAYISNNYLDDQRHADPPRQ